LERADGTFKIHVGYEANAAADIIRRNQNVPYFLRRFTIRNKYWCASGHRRTCDLDFEEQKSIRLSNKRSAAHMDQKNGKQIVSFSYYLRMRQ
jgi:hypothetical protein